MIDEKYSPVFYNGRNIPYLIHDTFKTTDSSPITTPRDCQPGPGVVDATSPDRFSISGKRLVIDSTSDANAKLDFTPEITRSAGLALGIRFKPAVATQNLDGRMWWNPAHTYGFTLGSAQRFTRSSELNTGFNIGAVSADYIAVIVAADTGFYYYGKLLDASIPQWNFYGRTNIGTDNLLPEVTRTATYPTWSGYIEWIRAVQLPNLFQSPNTIAQVYSANVVDGFTYIHKAINSGLNISGTFLCEVTFTQMPSTSTIIKVCITDSNNYLYYEITPTGTINYGEVVDGNATQKVTSANRIQAGERFAWQIGTLVAFGYEIPTTQSSAARIAYAGATPTKALSATNGSISLGGAVLNEFYLFDRNQPGEQTSILGTYFPKK